MNDSNTIYNYGNFKYGIIGAIDHTNLISVKIKDGRLPEKDNEVAIDFVKLYQLGYTSDDLNKMIDVEYTLYDGSIQHEKLLLCGILDDYYTICTHPTMIVTERNFESIQHIFFTGGINFSKIYEYKAGNHIDDEQREYENIYSNKLHYISIQQGLEFTKVIMIIVVAFMINVMNMNRIIKNQEDDIILLRGIGAKRGQIVWMILLEALVVLAVSLILGSILGFILSYMIIHMNQFIFYLETELYIESLIVSSLPLVFAVIFPTFRALNVSLNGRLNKKIKRIKTNYKKIINIPFLFYRRIQQNNMKVSLYAIGAILSLAFSINFYLRMSSSNINNQFQQVEYVSDYMVSSSGKQDNDQIIDIIKKEVNMKEVQICSVSAEEIELNRDTEYGIWDMKISNVSNRGRLTISTMDFYQSTYLQQLGIDEKEYEEGNVAFLYAPKQIHFIDRKKQNVYRPYNNLMPMINGVNIIQEDPKDIQEVEYGGKTIKIGAIIETLDGLMIDNKAAVAPYTIYMTSNNVSEEAIMNMESDIFIQTNDEFFDDVIYAKLSHVFNDKTIYAQKLFREEREKEHRKSIFEKLMYFLPLFSFFLLIIHEMIIDIENTRKNQIGIYHLVGLSYQNILKLVMYDIGIFIGIVSIIGSILGLYISTYQFDRYVEPFIPSFVNRIKFVGLYSSSSYICIICMIIVVFIWSILSIRHRTTQLFKKVSKDQSKEY